MMSLLTPLPLAKRNELFHHKNNYHDTPVSLTAPHDQLDLVPYTPGCSIRVSLATTRQSDFGSVRLAEARGDSSPVNLEAIVAIAEKVSAAYAQSTRVAELHWTRNTSSQVCPTAQVAHHTSQTITKDVQPQQVWQADSVRWLHNRERRQVGTDPRSLGWQRRRWR